MSSRITAIVSDFGGVLTTPLLDAFKAFQDVHDIPMQSLGKALMQTTLEDGNSAFFALERGEIPETQFLTNFRAVLGKELGREITIDTFAETFVRNLSPNPAMVEKMHTLKDAGYKMGLLTNNVREWETTWRQLVPVEEIFEVIVDSAFVGMRKPDAEIYDLTVERLGVGHAECVFIDDIEINCQAASKLGMSSVHFRSTEQALTELEKLLTD